MLAEGVPGGFAMLYEALSQLETLGICRRGYFVEGLGGAQFALPGAVERLRAQRAVEESPPLVLAATDPAQPYGAALPWPRARNEDAPPLPRACAGAYVVLAGAEPVLYVEKGGRGIVTLVDPRRRPSVRGLSQCSPRSSHAGRGRKLSLERRRRRAGRRLEAASLLLIEIGFRAGLTKLTLSV